MADARTIDVLRTRLRTGAFNTVCEDDLILPSDLTKLLDEIERLTKDNEKLRARLKELGHDEC